MSTLRDYQENAIVQVGKSIARGNRAVCLVMPTGCGKTKTAATMCERHLAKRADGKILWLAHREELVGQAFDELTSFGLSCGVIQSNPVRDVNPFRPVQVASIQTLVARQIYPDGITLTVYDEAHHALSEKWSPYGLHYKAMGVPVIGLTATPVRTDGIGLGEVFDDLTVAITVREAIEQGYLVPYELIAPKKPLRSGQIAQSPVKAYLAHAPGRKCAVFAGNLKAAAQFADEFNAAGIPAAVVDGKMDAGIRRSAIERYARGELRVLVNVGVLTEGWDDPPTDCVILARSLGSLSLYLQILGRGLRISPSTGKKDCIFIDLYGSSRDFGPPDMDRQWDLDGEAIKKGKLVNPFKHCPGCGVTLEGDELVCALCGIAKPELAAPEVMNIELVKFAAKRREGPDARGATLGRWLIECERLGHKSGRAYHRYKATYGEKPSHDVQEIARSIVAKYRGMGRASMDD